MARPTHALRVVGDSIINAGILNGDTVVVEYRDMARIDDIVVALIDPGRPFKRRKRRKDGNVEVIPENPAMAEAVHDR